MKELTKEQIALNEQMWDALWEDDSESLNTVLEKGADPNAKDAENHIPLFVCANGEMIDCMRVLLKHKADVLCRNERGQSLLDMNLSTEVLVHFQEPARRQVENKGFDVLMTIAMLMKFNPEYVQTMLARGGVSVDPVKLSKWDKEHISLYHKQRYDQNTL